MNACTFGRGVEVAQVLAPRFRLLEQRPLLLDRQRRRVGLGEDDVRDHRLPAAPDILEGPGVFLGEGRDRRHGPLDVGEPAEVAPIEEVLDDPRIWLVVVDAEALQLEVAVPGQHRDTAVENGVDVVPEAGVVDVLVRVEAAADLHVLLDHGDLQAGLAEVAGGDHPVVAGADDDSVVLFEP